MPSYYPTRRNLLKAGVHAGQALAMSTLAPKPLLAHLGSVAEPIPPIMDPRLNDLVAKGLDAAKQAGATYAEVRLTHTTIRSVSSSNIQEHEFIHTGVRSLVKGYWGFASGPFWSDSEMSRLGKEASLQATTNALGLPRNINLAPVTAAAVGHWDMPVRTDPFTVHPLAIQDYLFGLAESIKRDAPLAHGESIRPGVSATFWTQNRAFGSTTGSYCTQRLYRTEGSLTIEVERDRPGNSWVERRDMDLLTPAGMGWEYIQDQPLRDAVFKLVEEVHFDTALPTKPIDVNRYNVVLDASSVSRLVSSTIGAATELDRILGYEANKGGTSYLNAPFDMLDRFVIGSPLLTVLGNRSEPGGVATVNWDDEGVSPREIRLVDRGILRDVQTTRESAGWLSHGLSEENSRISRPFQSHGCASADTGSDVPITRTANLTMTPGTEERHFKDMVAELSSGIAMNEMSCTTDFQQSSGYGTRGRFYEVKNGKIASRLVNGGMLFRASELWNSLSAIGGIQSARRFGYRTTKGEPQQLGCHSVTSVPATFRDVTIVDVNRRG